MAEGNSKERSPAEQSMRAVREKIDAEDNVMGAFFKDGEENDTIVVGNPYSGGTHSGN